MMYYDYNKRSYLLPPGCKDLIDLLKLEEQKKQPSIQLPMLQGLPGLQGGEIFIAGTQEKEIEGSSIRFPAVHSIRWPGCHSRRNFRTGVDENCRPKPFKAIADLMEIGIFANVKQKIGFEAAARVLKKYGIIANKAP